MKHSGGTVSMFIAGAVAGAIAVEAIVCASYPQVKRHMMKKGMRALRSARQFGGKLF